MRGRIDVHGHLLAGVDDGCVTVAESVECARVLVENGYVGAVCTPHVWGNLVENRGPRILERVGVLQGVLDGEGIGLKLWVGGELNFRPELVGKPLEEVVTYGLGGKFVLADMWVEEVPGYFEECVRWWQGLGLTVIFAHPERMGAVQKRPELGEWFAELGVLLQGNLQCFADAEGTATRRVAEKYLKEGRYFLLGSDLHRAETLGARMRGLKRAIELVGDGEVGLE